MSSVDRSAVDRRLLGLARRSPVEIAELTGLDAGFVASRISELLGSRDWLSDRQQERLLLEEVAELKDLVMDELRSSVGGDDFVATASVALRALRLIGERLDSRRRLVDADIESIQAAQARLFGRAFDIALQSVVRVLGDGVDRGVVDAAVSDGLRLAARELESSVVSE